MKKILNLDGAKELTKGEKKAITGGEVEVVPSNCKRPYIVNGNGIECTVGFGSFGTVQYYNGRDYCCIT